MCQECQGWGLLESPTTCGEQYSGFVETSTWADRKPIENCSQVAGGEEAQNPYEERGVGGDSGLEEPPGTKIEGYETGESKACFPRSGAN